MSLAGFEGRAGRPELRGGGREEGTASWGHWGHKWGGEGRKGAWCWRGVCSKQSFAKLWNRGVEDGAGGWKDTGPDAGSLGSRAERGLDLMKAAWHPVKVKGRYEV